MAGILSRKGCGIGCGAVVLIGAAVIGISMLSMNHRYGRAFDAHDRLVEQHGKRAAFDPGNGPALPAERLERFLAVRLAIQEECIKLNTGVAAIQAIQGIEDPEHAPKQQVVKTGLRAVVGGFRQMMNLGDFAGTRNEALVEADMGLGEYLWTYALVYYGVLGKEPQLGFSEEGAGGLPPTVRRDLVSMLRHRAETLGRAPDALAWADAADRLEDRTRGNPLPEEPLPGVVESVAPYADRLERLWCRDSDPMEFLRLKAVWRGFGDE